MGICVSKTFVWFRVNYSVCVHGNEGRCVAQIFLNEEEDTSGCDVHTLYLVIDIYFSRAENGYESY